MASLAISNLFHDRVRLSVTLVGIIFALVLIIIQFGLFLGFLDTSANVVEHSGADLWITAPGIPHVNGGAPIPEKRRYKALAVPGVDRADKFILMFTTWKLPTGAQENVQIIGFDLNGGIGGPWNLVAGSTADLHGEDTVIVEEIYLPKLGVKGIGESVEIAGHRARIVGLTRGIRSFTTSPYVYTSFKNAQNYSTVKENQTLYLLIKAKSGTDIAALKQGLKDNVPDVDVYTNHEIWRKTQTYWVFKTGAGITTLMGAALGLMVGMVVVAQTIYAATVDHIREFGTLKAMGARNSYTYRVIIEQSLISALLGYAVAIAVGYFVVRSSAGGNAVILLPPEMAVGTLGLAVFMCIAASIISIRKATTIDPAMVFKG